MQVERASAIPSGTQRATQRTAMTRKYILSIDGGGIRGIIPICALIELEKQIGKPAREVFSFMAGTSTGAIIAGGLAVGISAEQALDIYRDLAPQVFGKDWLGWVTTLGSYRYRTQPLADLLRRYYGDATLNQLPVDVMITATRVRDGRAFYFVRDNPVNSQTTGALTLVDCVTASAAAPTYFQPWDVPGFGECVDGGVGTVGNPAYQACVEAFDHTPPGVYVPATTTVISLGTGYVNQINTPGNIVAWATWILGELLRDPAEQQTELIQRHYVPQGLIQHRLNPQLSKDIGLDDVNAIPELIAIGQAEAAKLDWHALLADRASPPVAPARIPRNAP